MDGTSVIWRRGSGCSVTAREEDAYPEVDITATDTSTLDGYSNLAFLQILASSYVFEGWLRFGNPQVVSGVSVDTNVWLGGLCINLGGGCRHVVTVIIMNCSGDKNMYIQ